MFFSPLDDVYFSSLRVIYNLELSYWYTFRFFFSGKNQQKFRGLFDFESRPRSLTGKRRYVTFFYSVLWLYLPNTI